MVLKNGETLEKYRAQLTVEYIRSWFRELEIFLLESNALDILNNPSRILNADETGFSLCPKTGNVLGLKWQNLYVAKKGKRERKSDCFSHLHSRWKTLPPVVVFPYVKPPRAVVGKSDSGWMRSDIFFEFVANDLNTCLNKQNIQRPVLFVVDGHRSHMSTELGKLCSNNNIILCALPPNATHFLQPTNVAVFKPLKEYWRQEVRAWQVENINRVVTKSDFCPILERVLQNPKLSIYFKNGSKSCGFVPIRPI